MALLSGCGGSDSGTSTEPVIETATDTAVETIIEASILRLDPRLDALIPTDAEVEKLAEGFVFIEGPVWLRGNLDYCFRMSEGIPSINGLRPTEQVRLLIRCLMGIAKVYVLFRRMG